MRPGEAAGVRRLRDATGASVAHCHMAWVLFDGDADRCCEEIRVRNTRERLRDPHKPRCGPAPFELLAQQWRERFGADWPQRPASQ